MFKFFSIKKDKKKVAPSQHTANCYACSSTGVQLLNAVRSLLFLTLGNGAWYPDCHSHDVAMAVEPFKSNKMKQFLYLWKTEFLNNILILPLEGSGQVWRQFEATGLPYSNIILKSLVLNLSQKRCDIMFAGTDGLYVCNKKFPFEILLCRQVHLVWNSQVNRLLEWPSGRGCLKLLRQNTGQLLLWLKNLLLYFMVLWALR